MSDEALSPPALEDFFGSEFVGWVDLSTSLCCFGIKGKDLLFRCTLGSRLAGVLVDDEVLERCDQVGTKAPPVRIHSGEHRALQKGDEERLREIRRLVDRIPAAAEKGIDRLQ